MSDMYPWERALMREVRFHRALNLVFKASSLIFSGLAAGLVIGSVMVWTWSA